MTQIQEEESLIWILVTYIRIDRKRWSSSQIYNFLLGKPEMRRLQIKKKLYNGVKYLFCKMHLNCYKVSYYMNPYHGSYYIKCQISKLRYARFYVIWMKDKYLFTKSSE